MEAYAPAAQSNNFQSYRSTPLTKTDSKQSTGQREGDELGVESVQVLLGAARHQHGFSSTATGSHFLPVLFLQGQNESVQSSPIKLDAIRFGMIYRTFFRVRRFPVAGGSLPSSSGAF
jgi:hypothetical protein